MTDWPKGELRRIVEADDLHIAPLREDGGTYGTPTWIWSVAVDGVSTFGPITAGRRAGTRPQCGKEPGGSPPRV